VEAWAVTAETTNPDGRTVVLYATTWNKVVTRHPNMADHLEAIMATIREPDLREPDPRPGRERYHRRGGPLRWVRVVTEIEGEVDRVITAFADLKAPHR